MDQHPIPRQITTFEFKLIGFLTLKQFLYLVASISVAIALFFVFPIPFINIILAGLAVLIGVVFAFIPIYDRPAEQLFKDFLNAICSPTQFVYKKNNQPLYFLNELVFTSNPHILVSHIESKEKLARYLQSKTKKVSNSRKNQLHQLLSQPIPPSKPKPPFQKSTPVAPSQSTSSSPTKTPSSLHKPFLMGVVKNNREIALPGILVYIKNNKGKVVRLLKTNPHGSFATFQSLPRGDYLIEIKDPSGGYFFDTMKLAITDSQPKKLEFISKETL